MVVLAGATLIGSSKEKYVSPDGNDANSGTKSSPWKTLTKAAKEAHPGETIIIRGGVYTQSLEPIRSGTKKDPVTFKAYPEETPVIEGVEYGIAIFNTNYVRFQGFEVRRCFKGFYSEGANTGCQLKYSSFHDNKATGIHWRDMKNGLVLGNQVYRNGAEGLNVTESSHNLIKSNNVHDDIIDGIYVDLSTHNRIEHNTVRDHVWSAEHTDGIQLWQSPENSIRSNHVYNTVPYQGSGGMGIFVEESPKCLIANNVVSKMESHNIVIRSSPGTIASGNATEYGFYGGIYILDGSTSVSVIKTTANETGDVLTVTPDSCPGFVCDFNDWQTDDNPAPIKWGDTWYSLDGFKDLGFDSHQ